MSQETGYISFEVVILFVTVISLALNVLLLGYAAFGLSAARESRRIRKH